MKITAEVELERSMAFIHEVQAKYNIIEKIKSALKPLLKKLTVGLLATGIFFGSGAKAADLNTAEKAANNYAAKIQEILSDTGVKVEAHAVKKGNIYRLKIKLTDPESKDYTTIELTEAGTGDNKFINLELKVNKGADGELNPNLEQVSKEVYDTWAKKKINLR